MGKMPVEKDSDKPEIPTASRRQARQDAMVVLYQRDLTGNSLEDLCKNLESERDYAIDEYTRVLAKGVLSREQQLDAAIDEASKGWPAHRLAALERNILRIAVYEMNYEPEIPVEVSIDEAVTLSKRFCSREAGSLINGILGRLAEKDGKDDR